MVIVPMEAVHAKGASILEEKNFSEPWSEKAFLEELTNPDSAAYYVALDGEKVVGTCGAIIAGIEADIMNVSVDPDYRRMGIASKLLEATLEGARQKGVLDFTLEVRANNTAARGLYEKFGFVFEGIRPRFYRNPEEDAAIYWLRQKDNDN